MSERLFRLVLAGVIFVTLFLRCNPLSEAEGVPNWLFILFVSMEALTWLFDRPSYGAIYPIDFIGWLNALSLLSPLSVTLLIPFNIFLVIWPFRGLSKLLRILYRILMLILFPLTWYLTFTIDPTYRRGMGFWAIPVVITVAALLEIAFLVGGHLRKLQNVDPAAE